MYNQGVMLILVRLPNSSAGPFTKETPTASNRKPVKNVMNLRTPLPRYLPTMSGRLVPS